MPISLAPGFSPVWAAGTQESGFNRFTGQGKPLKRLHLWNTPFTRLKPGANERKTRQLVPPFWNRRQPWRSEPGQSANSPFTFRRISMNRSTSSFVL